FHPVSVPGATLYRKQARAAAAKTSLDAALARPAALAKRARAVKGARAPTPIQLSRAEKDAAPHSLDDIRLMANTGAWREAIEASAAFRARHPLDPRGHFLAAILHLHSGEHEAAEAALKKSLYLDPDFALAYYYAAMLCAARNDGAAAIRLLRNLFASLDAVEAQAPVAGGDGLTTTELRALAQMQLRALEGRRP
ncbi:MAG: hypothetical protein AB7P23_04015, partial [Amphiplicatus sp.]